MSTEITPSTTPAPSTEAAPAPKPERVLHGRAELRARLTQKSNDVFAGIAEAKKFKDESPAPVSSATPNSEAVAETVASLEEAGVEVPDQKKTETKVQYETRIARLLLQVQRAESEGLKHKGALEKVNNELADLKAKFAEASSDPVKALKLANMTPDEMAQAMLDGKLSKAEEKVVKQELPPEVLELIEEGKRLKAEKAAQVEATENLKIREGNIKLIDTAKRGLVEQYPALELIPNDRLLDAYESIAKATGAEPDFAEFAAKLQDNVLGEVLAAVKHKGTLLELVKKDPELKAYFTKELGLVATVETPAVVESVKPKSTIAGTPTETPSRKENMSAAERKARAAQAASRVFGG